MTYFRTLFLFGAATCLLGQTPPPNAPPPGPAVKLEVENPGAKMPQVPPDRVIITVGDTKITAAQFDKLIDLLQPQFRAQARGADRKKFGEYVVQMLTLAQEAQRRSLTETSDYKTRAMFQNANLMATVMQEQLAKDVQVTEADLHQYYTEHKTEFDQVHARHILIRFTGSPVAVRAGAKDLTDAEALAKAQDLRKKIQGGADFAQLAKAESDDVSSGANGGDLNWFKHGQMVPTFEEVAFKLKPGELSEPVKTQFGYHVIQVLGVKSFDDLKPELEARAKPEQAQKSVMKAIDELQKAHPPVLDPEFFGADKAPEKAPDKK